jgi:hypothetical protein
VNDLLAVTRPLKLEVVVYVVMLLSMALGIARLQTALLLRKAVFHPNIGMNTGATVSSNAGA